jgi:hypothetical protein
MKKSSIISCLPLMKKTMMIYLTVKMMALFPNFNYNLGGRVGQRRWKRTCYDEHRENAHE